MSRQGTGYDNWPGLYTDEQQRGWREITEAVHAAGGRIVIQLFHAGRMSHPAFHQGALPVAPSAIAGGPATERYDGVHHFTRPRALRLPNSPASPVSSVRLPGGPSPRASTGWKCTPPTAICSTSSCATAPTSAATATAAARAIAPGCSAR